MSTLSSDRSASSWATVGPFERGRADAVGRVRARGDRVLVRRWADRRGVTLSRARSSADIAEVGSLVDLAGRFERLMVIPGSMAVFVAELLAAWAEDIPLWGSGSGWLAASIIVFLSTIPLVPLIFLPRGKVFEAALAEAQAQGRVTVELTAAFRDPAVAFARLYEGAAIAVVVALMVTKPF
jgi:hypothetical protein